MAKTNDRWSALSMKERADLINTYITNGVSDLKEIKKHYNSFGDGGEVSNNTKNDSYESEMTYSQANALNRYYGKEGPAFMASIGTEENPEFFYPEELQASSVKAFNSPDEERNFKVDQYLKELSRRKEENPLADYLAGLVLGVPTAGILQGLMPAAQYASGIKTAGKSVGKNAWKGIKHVGRVAKNPANAKTTIGTIGATLGDIYGTVSAIKGGAEILDKWSSGKFNHQDIPEFVLNLTGTIPAAYATKQSIDYASDLANSLYKSSKATKKLPHFEDPVITKANSAESINTIGNAEPIYVDPKVASIYNKQIAHQLSSKTSSKLSKAELEGISKGERNNTSKASFMQNWLKKESDIPFGISQTNFDAAMAEDEYRFLQGIDQGWIDDYNFHSRYKSWFKDDYVPISKGYDINDRTLKNLKNSVKEIKDEEIHPMFKTVKHRYTGEIETPFITDFRKYLKSLGLQEDALSTKEIQKILTIAEKDVNRGVKGKFKNIPLNHGSKYFFEEFDFPKKLGTYTSNSGAHGPGNYFYAYWPSRYGGKDQQLSQPFYVTDIESVLNRELSEEKNLINKYLSGAFNQNDIFYPKNGKFATIAGKLEYKLPNPFSTDITGRFFSPTHIPVEVAIPKNKGIKSLFPHPSRFIEQPDGTVKLIPTDWNDPRFNFKFGGKLLTKRK